MVSFESAQFCCCEKIAITIGNEWVWLSANKTTQQKQATGWMWLVGHTLPIYTLEH